MIRLLNAKIHKYKSIENEQVFNVEQNITILVGMNESGKTSILEALSKVNSFDNDKKFTFDMTHDYPRKQKKAMDRSGEIPKAVTLVYEITGELLKTIEADIGLKIASKSFSITCKYDNKTSWNVSLVTYTDFIANRIKTLKIKTKHIVESLVNIKNILELDALKEQSADADEIEALKTLKKYLTEKNNWNRPIDEYITTKYLVPNLPKFMYYDDYYMLPSRVSLDKMNSTATTESPDKTAKALLDLADIDVKKVVKAVNFEEFIAELEATQLIISEELFKYWSTNKNLKILFSIDKIEQTDPSNNTRIVDHVLDIRVQNHRSGVSLPLANRSKGFNWFFSFLVWFKKIQENKESTYILLLDEPGLNLHAKAQYDLLKFLANLSDNYQIIYTTHSPFMIDSGKLHQIRTVVEKEDGTHISDSVQEKDPNTLFPLQAALGYDLAQNLFVSPKNLIVEGIADLVYLNLLSEQLQVLKREGLRRDVTIVPVGGADKVATFVSLLRGNELGIVCLLDTFTDKSAQARLDNLITQNIIKDKKIVFYHNILKTKFADVEDLFAISDYLKLFNGAFSKKIKEESVVTGTPIMAQLKKENGNKDFNHYVPANYFAKNVATITLSENTLDNFETLFKRINKLF